MYESLSRYSKEFHLYIFAFDELAYEILVKLKLTDVTVISLHDFETEELKDKKKTRSVAEYCWTCTPSTIAYVLENFNVPDCTYIDSDLCFYSDPSVLIKEMIENKKNVLITEHRFSSLPAMYELKRGGRFCVQFITFLNEESSLKVLDRWRKQCINWCYARYEDNKFGDQKYLEEWPMIYSNIHILQHQVPRHDIIVQSACPESPGPFAGISAPHFIGSHPNQDIQRVGTPSAQESNTVIICIP